MKKCKKKMKKKNIGTIKGWNSRRYIVEGQIKNTIIREEI